MSLSAGMETVTLYRTFTNLTARVFSKVRNSCHNFKRRIIKNNISENYNNTFDSMEWLWCY